MATITGGYWSPLVMGLTPWTSTAIQTIETRSDWPPTRDSDRLQAYKDYLALIENRPWDVFDDLGLAPDQKEKIIVAANLPELLCNVWADSIWTDPPTIELPSTAAQDAWDAIDSANDWSEIGAWESVFAAAFVGHSVVRLFRSEQLGALNGNEIQIEEIDPAIYFPTLRKGSARIVESVTLAWEEDRSDPDARRPAIWQVRELHQVIDGSYTITKQERRPEGMLGTASFKTVATTITDDVDFLPFVDMHAKRWRGRYWGVSELARQLSLVDQIDNTLSNISEILEYHGKPLLQVPADALFGGLLSKGADKTLGIRNPALADVARYITYDGQIAAQLEELDKLTELAFLTAEVPRTYFGLGLEGGVPSGTSLKLQLQNYLKKATRWQRNETRRSRQLVDYALRLTGEFSDATARETTITHGSPLPVDDEQEARIEEGLVTAGLSSKKLAITRLRRVPADKLDNEIAQIEKEKQASVESFGLPGAGTDGQPTPRPGQPGQPGAGEQA